MSQREITMTVVNASSKTIDGTAWHASGSGTGRILSPNPALPVNLPSFGVTDAVAPNDIEVRSDHDDYWFWQPTGAAGPVECAKNCKAATVGVCLVITDIQLVVVTSDNGWRRRISREPRRQLRRLRELRHNAGASLGCAREGSGFRPDLSLFVSS
jgi:hypothetical protein